MLLYILLCLPPLLYVLWKPFLRFLTPATIPGIPAYPDPQPILGDLARVGERVKETGSFTKFIDGVVRDLGVISQLRMGPLGQYVWFSLVRLSKLTVSAW
jgi:hypothetical protein